MLLDSSILLMLYLYIGLHITEEYSRTRIVLTNARNALESNWGSCNWKQLKIPKWMLRVPANTPVKTDCIFASSAKTITVTPADTSL